MKWLFILMFLSCSGMPEPKKTLRPVIKGHDLAESGKLSFYLETPVSENSARKTIFLLQSPQNEILLERPKNLVPLVFKKQGVGKLLVNLRKPLAGGVYGVYWQESASRAVLLYTFKAAYPSKVEHDLGEELKVGLGHKAFSFRFLGPVSIDDESISIKNLSDGPAPVIESLLVSADQKTVELRLKDGKSLKVGQYSFIFGPSLKVLGEQPQISPISFSVTNEQHRGPGPITFAYSDQAVEFRAQKGKYELFFDERQHLFEENFYLSGLTAGKTYHFLLRQETDQGLWQALGNFTTESTPESLHIGEIKTGENGYLKIINMSKEAQSLADISLSVDNKKGCSLDKVLPAGGELFIGGAGFKPNGSRELKSDCLSFAGKNPAVIRLYRKDRLVDRYGGHLWTKKRGTIIKRIEIKGLDEPGNYCY